MDQPAPSIARVELFPKDATPLPENASVFLDMLVVKFSSQHVLIEYFNDSKVYFVIIFYVG